MVDQEKILYLANGIPGAIVVLAAIKRDHEDQLVSICENLATNDIRGSHIWNIFKNLCHEDIEQFLSFDFQCFIRPHYVP